MFSFHLIDGVRITARISFTGEAGYRWTRTDKGRSTSLDDAA